MLYGRLPTTRRPAGSASKSNSSASASCTTSRFGRIAVPAGAPRGPGRSRRRAAARRARAAARSARPAPGRSRRSHRPAAARSPSTIRATTPDRGESAARTVCGAACVTANRRRSLRSTAGAPETGAPLPTPPLAATSPLFQPELHVRAVAQLAQPLLVGLVGPAVAQRLARLEPLAVGPRRPRCAAPPPG